MITTPNDFLIELSDSLNETSTDTSAKRVRYFNRAARQVKKARKWSWNKKPATLTLVAGTKEYDMTVQAADFNPVQGIYEVYLAGVKMSPCSYEQVSAVTSEHFYLKPDNKTIGFTMDIAGNENIVVWYYPRHTSATTKDTVLDPSLPEDMIDPIVTLMKSFVHKGKRQRNDERNELLIYKEQIGDAILADAGHKIKDAPHTVTPVLGYHKIRRRYNY